MTPQTLHRVVSKACTGHAVRAMLVKPQEDKPFGAVVLEGYGDTMAVIVRHGTTPEKLGKQLRRSIKRLEEMTDIKTKTINRGGI